ncbi:YbaN family protein [Halomonas sp. PA5]|nr:YbaN family protein [Halomonas populi]QJQ97080.1 YbaN family protein [Halomonas sp. PA5]
MRNITYLLFAWLCFALGVIGVFVPLMPTTCFMLLAVWSASRGSPRFAAWIRRHPRFGPPVLAWEQERAIPRHVKRLAVAMLAFSMLVIALVVNTLTVKLALIVGLGLLGVWIATRPEPRQSASIYSRSGESELGEPRLVESR